MSEYSAMDDTPSAFEFYALSAQLDLVAAEPNIVTIDEDDDREVGAICAAAQHPASRSPAKRSPSISDSVHQLSPRFSGGVRAPNHTPVSGLRPHSRPHSRSPPRLSPTAREAVIASSVVVHRAIVNHNGLARN